MEREEPKFQNSVKTDETKKLTGLQTIPDRSFPPAPNGQGNKRATVLIVDDAHINRDLLKKIFGAQYLTQEAAGGKQALELLRKIRDISIVILDLNMPEMSGFEVMAEMQREPQLSSIPVIVVTASADAASEARALRLGAADVIQKPFRTEALMLRARNLIGRREAHQLEEQNLIYELRLRQQEELLRIAQFDEKTGIYNRQTFCRKASELLKKNAEIPYLIVRWDIDHFKVYNDIFGTEAGDRFLAQAGKMCKKYAPPDSVCCHYDADHFICCMPEKNFQSDWAIQYAKKWLSSMQTDFDFVPRFGVYRVEDHNLDVGLMCDRALLALRATKGGYTRCVAYYQESMRRKLIEEQEIVSEMSDALENGQFSIVLQPQYNHVTGQLFGAEALARWIHPRKGLMQPATFLPIFERNGFITKMDECIWEQTCRLMHKWRTNGIEFVPISVNISRVDVYNPRLVSILTGVVQKYGLEPSMLRLEITESAYMENPEQLIAIVKRLRAEGFLVEIDDFGSGFSSLNTLKDVPADALKLDMKFLSSTENTDASGVILNSVVRMARWLNLPVIAEGVETTRQADYLKTIGCHLVQGYLYGKPMPVEQFEQLLSSVRTQKTFFSGQIDTCFDSGEFWSPEAQASVIFNSLVGSAGIFEVHNDRVEALRVNDRFFEEFHLTRERFAQQRDDLLYYILPQDKPVLLRAMNQSLQERNQTHCKPVGACRVPFSLRSGFAARSG